MMTPSHTTYTPKFIYCFREFKIIRAKLSTGAVTSFKLGVCTFRLHSAWCEVPGYFLYFSGGKTDSRCVDRLDTTRDFAKTLLPQMLRSRSCHAFIEHQGYLYSIGGLNYGHPTNSCERFAINGSSWEILDNLQIEAGNLTAIVLDEPRCLYTLGGCIGNDYLSDRIQRLSLETLKWDVLAINLPNGSMSVPCFKLKESEAYFVVGKALYKLTPLKILKVKDLKETLASDFGPSYYHNGTLYCSVMGNLKIGSL